MSYLPTRPMTPALAHDLTDAEIAELNDLLAATPEPLEPLDVVMLDGYLCGVIVQPMLLQPDAWLPPVFDFDVSPLPADVDPAWLERTTALILRRHAALNRAIVEDGWFEPLVPEADDEDEDDVLEEAPDGATGTVGAWPALASDETAPEADNADPQVAAAEQAATAQQAASEGVDDLDPITRSIMPWVAGFQHATIVFPALIEMPDEAVMASLARLYRYLPAETDEAREVIATLDREFPLTTLDDAIDDLVVTIADLQDLTCDQRYKVETVKRDAPKVGRNDPCPCGSGKKFKQCHGAA